jgi:hypothetical protein
MASKKLTITMPEATVSHISALASRENMPLSTWITRAAEDRARIEDGLQALQEWYAESGEPSPADRARARALLADADAQVISPSQQAA